MEKGKTHILNITSSDVTHSFWVPEFRIKQDATPGFIRSIQITPEMTHEEAGYPEGFPLRCTEFCGAGHSVMLANVHVLEPAAYEAWEAEQVVAAQSDDAPGPDATSEEIVAFGLDVYEEYACGACHQLDLAETVSAVGPTHNDLDETAEERVGSPDYTGTADSAAGYLTESIRDPGAHVVSGYQNIMPAFTEEQISDAELDALVQMLMLQDEAP
jgi:cytochrome c oxidase subunit 2